MEKIICEQCAVWRPREEVTFLIDEAEKHAIAFHAHRFLKAYRTFVLDLYGDSLSYDDVRANALKDMLKNRCAP